MGLRNIRIMVAYDGTDFQGWQVQKNGRTVQGVLEEALQRMHGHPVRVYCAGRTDSGVHAVGQVINFLTDIDSIPEAKYYAALNSYLPKDVRVLRSEKAVDNFHSRYNALSRTYRYYIFTGRVCLPQYRNYCYHIKKKVDITLLNRMAAYLVGEHDFTTFSIPSDESPSRVRNIKSAIFFPEGQFLIFEISGSSFLWKMVRSLVGTMLELEKEKAEPQRIKALLDAKDWKLAGSKVPAKGLFLYAVEYDELKRREKLKSYTNGGDSVKAEGEGIFREKQSR
ncbi:MAG: tRNA pseudouridine(38-40) synthase TruA [Spirochaetota bacterium]